MVVRRLSRCNNKMIRRQRNILAQRERDQKRTELAQAGKAVPALEKEISALKQEARVLREQLGKEKAEWKEERLDLKAKLESAKGSVKVFKDHVGIKETDKSSSIRDVLRVMRYDEGNKKGELLSKHYAEKLKLLFPEIVGVRKLQPYSSLEERQKRRRMRLFGDSILARSTMKKSQLD